MTSFVKVSGPISRIVESAGAAENCESSLSFWSCWVIPPCFPYTSMFGWAMNTSSEPDGSSGLRKSETAGGARNRRAVPRTTAVFALALNLFQFPVLDDISIPNTARLDAHIHRDPPRVPVNSYH